MPSSIVLKNYRYWYRPLFEHVKIVLVPVTAPKIEPTFQTPEGCEVTNGTLCDSLLCVTRWRFRAWYMARVCILYHVGWMDPLNPSFPVLPYPIPCRFISSDVSCHSWSSYKVDHKRDKIGVFVSTVSTKIPFKVCVCVCSPLVCKRGF